MALWRANCWINLISICDRRRDSADKEEEINVLYLNFLSRTIPRGRHRKEGEGTLLSGNMLPSQSDLLCFAHSSFSPCPLCIYLRHLPHIMIHLLAWLLVIFFGSSIEVLSPQLNGTLLSGGQRFCLLLLHLPQCAVQGCDCPGLSVNAGEIDGSRFSSFLYLPRKGYFELDSKFQQNLIGRHRHVCLFPETLPLYQSQDRTPVLFKQEHLLLVFSAGLFSSST